MNIINKEIKIFPNQYKSVELFHQEIKQKLDIKYFSNFNFYFAKPINEILANISQSHVIQFKDMLYDDEENEYLKRYYYNFESPNRINLLTNFYLNGYKETRPNLCLIECNKIIQKRNFKQVKLFQKNIENNEQLTIPPQTERIIQNKDLDKILPSILQEQESQKSQQFDQNNCKIVQNQKNDFQQDTDEDIMGSFIDELNRHNQNQSYETTLHDIYNPSLSMEFDQDLTIVHDAKIKSIENDLKHSSTKQQFENASNVAQIYQKEETQQSFICHQLVNSSLFDQSEIQTLNEIIQIKNVETPISLKQNFDTKTIQSYKKKQIQRVLNQQSDNQQKLSIPLQNIKTKNEKQFLKSETNRYDNYSIDIIRLKQIKQICNEKLNCKQPINQFKNKQENQNKKIEKKLTQIPIQQQKILYQQKSQSNRYVYSDSNRYENSLLQNSSLVRSPNDQYLTSRNDIQNESKKQSSIQISDQIQQIRNQSINEIHNYIKKSLKNGKIQNIPQLKNKLIDLQNRDIQVQHLNTNMNEDIESSHGFFTSRSTKTEEEKNLIQEIYKNLKQNKSNIKQSTSSNIKNKIPQAKIKLNLNKIQSIEQLFQKPAKNNNEQLLQKPEFKEQQITYEKDQFNINYKSNLFVNNMDNKSIQCKKIKQQQK